MKKFIKGAIVAAVFALPANGKENLLVTCDNGSPSGSELWFDEELMIAVTVDNAMVFDIHWWNDVSIGWTVFFEDIQLMMANIFYHQRMEIFSVQILNGRVTERVFQCQIAN